MFCCLFSRIVVIWVSLFLCGLFVCFILAVKSRASQILRKVPCHWATPVTINQSFGMREVGFEL